MERCLYTVFMYLLMFFINSGAQLTEDLLKHNAEVLKNIKSYEIVKPYRSDGRKKRHLSTRHSAGHVQETTVVFPGKKKRFELDISLNKGLFSPDFEEHLSDVSKEVVQQLPHEHCFYHGTVNGEKNSVVSLSTCDGIEGVVRTDDETYFIHPLKSPDGEVLDDHVIFRADDIHEEAATCGHKSHKRSLERKIKTERLTDSKKRVRRNVDTEEKFVELFLINDYDQYIKMREKSGLRAKQLANHLDSIFRFYHIRIALVKVETWSDRDKFSVDRNASKALANFLTYKKDKLDGDILGEHWDNAQLLTGKDFLGDTVGLAPIQSICGRQSAAVVMDHSRHAMVTATTMGHELGHNFGMTHDGGNCLCPDEKGCVMSAKLSPGATKFSRCSIKSMENTLEDGYGTCLFDEPKKLYGDAICGNGFVEEGEQCDCGREDECAHFENKCCNATSCMLLPGAACSHGECCDNCQISSRGKECRKKYNVCDLPEYCTGDNELCPEDYHVHDGLACYSNSVEKSGYCYEGVCRNLNISCQYIFGDGVWAGGSCFERNTEGRVYNCRNSTHGEFPCPKEDTMCGRIHCKTFTDPRKKPVPPIIGQERGWKWITVDHKEYCLVSSVSHGDGVDLRYVQDGTKCGDGKMCMNSRCVPVVEAIPISAYNKCENNCSGNGVCNNAGNCHCNSGYACPDCKELGNSVGGSFDSGQGCSSSSDGINVAAAVLVPIFLLLLIGAAVVIYIKRRTIQDRLRHYKFVRRSTGTSSSGPPARKSQPSVLHSGLISNPTPADQPVVQTRRAPPPPGRPSAPLMSNEQPPPTSTPAQQLRPLKPPTVQASHQSVPLFPPSAVPQEKARPSPPTRPIAKSNLPRTPSAPPTAPNRPKLPPSQPPSTYKSTPDIPSASQPKATPPVAKRGGPPRPKPRASPSTHRSVPEFPDDAVPVPKPRTIAPRPGHQSVPLFNLPDNLEEGARSSPAKPSPPRKPRQQEEGNRVDFRAALKPVPKPWEKI